MLKEEDRCVLGEWAERLKSSPDTKPLDKLVMLALPLLIRTLEVFGAVFVEDPEACGYFVD